MHDLRDWTHDRHRTVDDTPYGGGAGMVMKPEPWGEALDALVPRAAGAPCWSCPPPAVSRSRRRSPPSSPTRERLVFACGRYEGIDQRVLDEAATRMTVREVSLGDYVLNGGEVAALVVTEAVARLLPGFMGNPESLTEESHGASGLLEYPVYTKPAAWRGHEVPSVLLSGDHGRIAAWRHEQAVRRTADRRPDLLHPSATLTVGGSRTPRSAPRRRRTPAELLTLQLRLLGHRGAGQRHPRDPAAARGPRRRPRLADGLDHVRRTVRAAPGRARCGAGSTATCGTSAG